MFLTSKWLSINTQTNMRDNLILKLIDIMEKTQQKWNVRINGTLA